MLVLLDDAGKIASYADVPDIALQLIEVCDKPTTIIYPNAHHLAENLIAEDRSIGIRIMVCPLFDVVNPIYGFLVRRVTT